MKTRFQNLFYLEKALNRLNIVHKERESTGSALSNTDLVIPQSNGYNITFAWNGEEYELVADMSFWKQPDPVDNFINKIAQQYAGEVIVRESQKIGFQPIKYNRTSDGLDTLVLERWNTNN